MKKVFSNFIKFLVVFQLLHIFVACSSSSSDNDNDSDTSGGGVTYSDIYEENKAFAREVAGQTIVLLKNDNDVLPLDNNESVNVFGIAQVNYYKGGSGSGNVSASYSVSPLEGMLANKSINVNEELATAYVNAYGSLSGNLGEYLEGTTAGEGNNTTSTDEIEITESLLTSAKNFGSTAIVCISRISGEDNDRDYAKGDYLLTDDETTLLSTVTGNFSKVIVLINSPGPIDMNWASTYVPDAILFVGMPGMEGGNAIADVLSGDVYPSAKLAETWAINYDDIPSSKNMGSFIKGTVTITTDNLDEINSFYKDPYWGAVPNREPYTTEHIGKVIAIDDYYYTEYEEGIYVGYRYFETFGVDVKYPFGYGLSYTTFSYTVNSVKAVDDKIVANVTVKNTGDTKGREVIQVYYGAPDGTLENPTKELAAYAKTDELDPDESQTLTISYDINDMASFITSSASYVLESGNYKVYVGTSVQDVESFDDVYSVSTDRVVKICSNMEFENTPNLTLLSKNDPTGTYPTYPGEEYDSDYVETYIRSMGGGGTNAEEITAAMITAAESISGVTPSYTLQDVYNGIVSMDTFVDQMDPIELAAMLVGDGAGYDSSFTYLGSYSQNAVGAGSTPTITRLGIPTINFADGPAGVSVGSDPTAWPVGVNQAMSWDDELMEELGDHIAREAIAGGVDYWLAPSLNIKRSPLCGRNFEYLSEDPVISGSITAAIVRGVQSRGVGVCIKHYAINNRETYRFYGLDSVVDERTAREIYLKGFQIVVETANPWSIMTSYNCINGSYAATIKSLNTTIPREEWGFDGFIATDWEGDAGYGLATLVSGNDLLMPGFTGQFVYVYKMLADGVDDLYTNESELISDLTTEYGDTEGMVEYLNSVAKLNVKRILNGVLRSQSYASYAGISYENPYEHGDSLFVVKKGGITSASE